MKKIKFFILIATLAIMVTSVCGCNNTEANENQTTDALQESSVVATVLTEASVQNNTEAEESEPEFSLEDDDLEIVTLPRTEAEDADADNTEAESNRTESIEESTIAQTTEEKKIELPFVPAD